MTMTTHLHSRIAALAALLALGVSLPALAQTIPYGGGYGSSSSNDSGDDQGDEGDSAKPAQSSRGKRVEVTPYIEAAQVAVARLSPGSDTVTYSTLAAGVDASVNGRNNQASVSLRYERSFGWGANARDSDTISGIARVSAAVVPQTLTIEAGGLAARSQVEANGASVLTPLGSRDTATQVYSVYAGPSLHVQTGDVAINGNYRAGYTRVDSPNIVAAPGQVAVDVFDESVVHNARIHAATKAGDVLPVGLGVGAGYNREDVSNLDQRISDAHVRADVSVPLGRDVALVGGVGYEKVEVSNRDAVRDANGVPVLGSDGRLVTDKSAPRILSYNADGLIWDAGVMWRPSRRTALEAHVGRRYGSTTYYGSFAYAPNTTTNINVSVYDGITGFGGQINNALANLPTSFRAARNPLTGEITGCVVAQDAGSCLGGALGSVRSSVFRSRGVMATYGKDLGRIQTGFGVGYDRRKFIGAPGTILALANGVTDENVWLAAYLNGRIDQNSGFATNFYSTWYQSGDALAGDFSAIGATAAYNRNLTSKLSATAALGVDSIHRDVVDDSVTASALVGVRYSF